MQIHLVFLICVYCLSSLSGLQLPWIYCAICLSWDSFTGKEDDNRLEKITKNTVGATTAKGFFVMEKKYDNISSLTSFSVVYTIPSVDWF